jgi:hypothetical protein
LVEVQSPQAKPWLIRLESFQIRVRPGPQRVTVRDEILAVLPELVDERGEFTMQDLVARLNPDNDNRTRWAVEKALMRLRAVEEPGSALTRL